MTQALSHLIGVNMTAGGLSLVGLAFWALSNAPIDDRISKAYAVAAAWGLVGGALVLLIVGLMLAL